VVQSVDQAQEDRSANQTEMKSDKTAHIDISQTLRLQVSILLNARHLDVLLITINDSQNTPAFIIIFYLKTTCFDSFESSSGRLMNQSNTI